MFKNEVLKKTSEQASKFKMPYLVPQSIICDYCLKLKNYPKLVGTHIKGCKELDRMYIERNRPWWGTVIDLRLVKNGEPIQPPI